MFLYFFFSFLFLLLLLHLLIKASSLYLSSMQSMVVSPTSFETRIAAISTRTSININKGIIRMRKTCSSRHILYSMQYSIDKMSRFANGDRNVPCARHMLVAKNICTPCGHGHQSFGIACFHLFLLVSKRYCHG